MREAATARLVAAHELAPLGPGWDRLSAAALEENAFFARPTVLAALGTVDAPEAIRVLCVERHAGPGEPEPIALLPLRRSVFRYGAPWPVARAANNVFQTSGTPLLHRDHAAEAAAALVAAFGRVPGLPARCLLPNLRLDGPAARLVAEAADEAGGRVGRVADLMRPVLRRRPETGAAYLARRLPAKRARELARAERRLAESGPLAYRHLPVGDPDLPAAVVDFPAIEAEGWKGRAGTAFRSDPRAEAFARAAFAGPGAVGTADLLTLDGRAIAVCLNLQAGRTAFAIKCCYDETFRRMGPGFVLEARVARHLMDAGFADEIDSCTTEPDHPVAELWDGAEPVGTLALDARPGWRAAAGLDLAAAERTRRTARLRTRALVHAARDGRAAGPDGLKAAATPLAARWAAVFGQHADMAVAVAAFA